MRLAKHSRFPVYREHRDTVVGILHSRDLLGVDLERLEEDPDGLRGLLREPSFFPETKPAVELFDTFRQRRQSFALVVDEFGGVTGLVTMEDLLECVFGEIRSPSDVPHSELIEELGDGRYSLDAALSVIDFNQVFSTSLDGEQAETLGGVLLNAFGELPQDGAAIELQGFRFTVVGVEANRITRISMERAPALAEVTATPTPDEQRS
jgi:CBS domain containing-hemolysin-like protein